MAKLKEYHAWSELPSNLKTKTRLKTMNLRPNGDPVAVMILGKNRFNLFDETKAVPLEYDTVDVGQFTFHHLKESEFDEYAMLSLTTTGTRKTDEIIQLVMMDMKGNFIYNRKFKPTIDIHPLAYKAHRIASYELADEKEWKDCWYEISKLLEGKTLIMSDYKFFIRMIQQTCHLYSCVMDFKMNIFDLKTDNFLLMDLSKDVLFESSVQPSSPCQDVSKILATLNPSADLVVVKPMALKAYSDMCQRISEDSGRNGFAEGTNWLMKNFHTSCFDNLDLRYCRMILKALKK